jgi:hypothetical protein
MQKLQFFPFNSSDLKTKLVFECISSTTFVQNDYFIGSRDLILPKVAMFTFLPLGVVFPGNFCFEAPTEKNYF